MGWPDKDLLHGSVIPIDTGKAVLADVDCIAEVAISPKISRSRGNICEASLVPHPVELEETLQRFKVDGQIRVGTDDDSDPVAHEHSMPSHVPRQCEVAGE